MLTFSEAQHQATIAIQARLVPMIHGSPGIGKSAVIHGIASKFQLKIIDLRLSQCDPTDLMGFPDIARGVQRPKAGYVPMETFPIEGDSLPEGCNGWLLALDEFNSASVEVQAAAYKLVLDRMVGIHKLHKNVAVICAGNLETDGAIVTATSTAMQSRLVHLEMGVNLKEWQDYALATGFDHRITSYLDFRPDHIYTFKPDHTGFTYACPRTWGFVNNILRVSPETKEISALLEGTLGVGVAKEFCSFCRLQDGLPKMQDVLTHPHSTPVPHEPALQYALCGAIAAYANEDNAEALMGFIKRMSTEFQVVGLRSMVKRNKALIKLPSIAQWTRETAQEFI